MVAQVGIHPKPSFGGIADSLPFAKIAKDNDVRLRTQNKTSLRIIASGSSISGARSLLEIVYHLRHYIKMLGITKKQVFTKENGKITSVVRKNIGSSIKCTEITIVNIVAKASKPVKPMNLKILMDLDRNNTEYNPSVFTGCINTSSYRAKEKIIFFDTGQIISTGCISLSGVKMAIKRALFKVVMCDYVSVKDGSNDGAGSSNKRYNDYYGNKNLSEGLRMSEFKARLEELGLKLPEYIEKIMFDDLKRRLMQSSSFISNYVKKNSTR